MYYCDLKSRYSWFPGIDTAIYGDLSSFPLRLTCLVLSKLSEMTAIEGIPMKFGSDIKVGQRKNPYDVTDPLSFSPGAPRGWHLKLWVKRLIARIVIRLRLVPISNPLTFQQLYPKYSLTEPLAWLKSCSLARSYSESGKQILHLGQSTYRGK